MKILVCIKQVADTESNLKPDNNSFWIIEDKNIAFRMNRYDEYALEEALAIKDVNPWTTVDTVSVGPERALSTAKKCLEKGADKAIHLVNPDPALTARESSFLISEYAADKHYDIIFTGVMSEDLMQSQVGPMVASFLSIPSVVNVVKIDPVNDSTLLSVYSELEGGITERIEINMPCLITVQTGVNLPRYPSLSNVIRARSMQVISIDSTNSKLTGNYEEVLSIDTPAVSSRGFILTGTSEEKADKLLDLFHEKALL